MSKHHKPVAGSRGYWPRKRALRIYPRINHIAVKLDKVSPLEFGAYKTGMTHVVVRNERKGTPAYGQSMVKPVTVLECPALVVCGIRVYKRIPKGLKATKTVWMEKLSKDLSRKTTIPKEYNLKENMERAEKLLEKAADVRLIVHTQPKETGFGKKTPELFEVGLSGDLKAKWEYAKQKIGGQLKPEELFKEGEFVDVVAITKGKGYQGPVKRYGIKVRSRKNKLKTRHVGSLGPYHPARVLAGKIPQAGQLGFQRRTEFNKKIVKIGNGEFTPNGGWVNYGKLDGSYMLLTGSVPGPKKRLVMLRKATRTAGLRHEPLKVEAISLESQQ